ncbi:hypothetical protein CPB84DRAFT_1749130 [Gymnopilus junonius]|uniref:DUF6534 domain-containing protein n=1 Tax=Gymnopilus junonius TaxID=109634 RepID=A0A9P5NJF9_GYMJU|nr:hypothetical protein CPB84DRAFT_1749130 [Gymnopilus junonius]
MDMKANPPPVPGIVQLTGPLIVGYLLHWGLLRVLCAQTYIISHFLMIHQEQKITQTLILTNTALKVFGPGFGNLEVFSDIETFYTYRLKVNSQSTGVALLIIIFLAFVQLGGSIATGVIVKHAGSFTHLLGLDYTITATFWNGLSRSRERGMARANVIIRKVTMLVMETGVITVVIASLNLVLACLPGKPSYYLATSEIIAKVYSNSMTAQMPMKWAWVHEKKPFIPPMQAKLNLVLVLLVKRF